MSAFAWSSPRASPPPAWSSTTRPSANRPRYESTWRSRWWPARGSRRPGKSAIASIVAERRPDEIILSSYPATQSGWLRRDLIERIHNASGLPVEHIVTDLEQEGLPFLVTLVLANKTASGEELFKHLQEKAGDGQRHVFIAVIPLQDGSGSAPREARARLAAMLDLGRGAVTD